MSWNVVWEKGYTDYVVFWWSKIPEKDQCMPQAQSLLSMGIGIRSASSGAFMK